VTTTSSAARDSPQGNAQQDVSPSSGESTAHGYLAVPGTDDAGLARQAWSRTLDVLRATVS
jgi:hypothetical protein